MSSFELPLREWVPRVAPSWPRVEFADRRRIASAHGEPLPKSGGSC